MNQMLASPVLQMADSRIQRRLAAILVADVVGYGGLMEHDEVGTLIALKARRRDVLGPLIDQHQGRLVKLMGDGVLVEFASAVNAVQCAADLQARMAEVNDGLPDTRRIVLRIGINLGDVIVEGGDLYGDGVNVAARLESLAGPGDICVSGSVYDQVKRKLTFGFDELGPQAVKNIAEPVHVYRVRPDEAAAGPPGLPLPDKPSIAVLPFVNMSGDAEQEYLADGITEDIITALSRFRWFFVIARNSTFAFKGKPIEVKRVARDLGVRYVLEGSIRRSGMRLRISAKLINAASGVHIWAERYDRDLTDILAVQDEIAEQVVGAIEPELLKTEGRAATSRTANITAWELIRQGTWLYHQVTRETHLRARELFREAIRLDPRLPEANIWLARVNAGIVPHGWSDRPGDDLLEGLQAAHQAVQLDERNPYSHYALAIVSVFGGELAEAEQAAGKAIELSPSFALGHFALGMARLFSGQAAAAIEPLEHGVRLSPFDPHNFIWFQVLALAHYFSGQREEALEIAQRAVNIRPSWQPTLERVAFFHAALGHIDEARAVVGRMRQLERPPRDVLAPLAAHNPRWEEEIARMLRKAGWPA